MGNLAGSKYIASAIPVVCGFLGVIVTNLPFSVFGSWLPAPMYALMPIYFWSLVRPDLMTPVWIFIIGLTHDVISGEPPGIWAGAFVATYAVIDRQRDAFAGLSGWGAILGFATASLVACTANYAISCLLDWMWLPASGLAKEFAVTSLLYIPVALALSWLHRHFVGPLRSEF